MGRFVLTVVILVFVALAQPANAASPRIALVIGNSGYKIAPPLANPANDARLMAETLRGLGFDVIERIDADRDTILLATFELQDRLIAAGTDAVGLFFYAGHGVQVAGENYFIPLGTEIRQEREIAVKTVSASFVLKQMEFAGNNMNFVILDACRNNPFPASTRAATRGLARMLAPSGSLVAYSTGPGDVAVDGAGDNSPYVLALSQAMRTPGLPAELMFKRVRELVLEATNNEQTPWEESSLKGANFYFSVGVSVTVEAPETLATSDFTAATLQESLFWQSIKDSDNPSDYRAYLQAYPNGVFAMLAETRVEFFETERLATAQDDAAEEAIRSTTTQTEIELAFWNSIKSSSNAADYTAYLDAYPDGSFSALARARLASTEDAGQKAAELELWQSVEASGAAADYQAYIDAYPNGVHAALARARADALQAASEGRTTSIASETELAFWEAIGNEGAAEEYRAYLQQFPDGAFAVLALARMSEAEKTRRQEEELFEADLFPQELEVFAVSFSSLPKVGDALSNRELELAFIRYYKENLTHGWSIDDVTKMVVTRMTEDSIELGMTAQLMRYRHNGSKSGYFIARLEKFGSRYALVNVEW